jgi:hypothetical protein
MESCTICPASFKNQKTLRRHVAAKHTMLTFECDACDKTFGRRDHLTKHRLAHGRKVPSRFGPMANMWDPSMPTRTALHGLDEGTATIYRRKWDQICSKFKMTAQTQDTFNFRLGDVSLPCIMDMLEKVLNLAVIICIQLQSQSTCVYSSCWSIGTRDQSAAHLERTNVINQSQY